MKPNQARRAGLIAGRHGQKGFGMAIALAVLAVFALIAGAIALANKGGTSKTDAETSKVMATSIVNRGNELLAVAQRLAVDRVLNTMTMTSTSVAGTSFGMYDPAIGMAVDVPISGKAFAVTSSDVSFVLDKTAYTVVGLGPNGTTVAAVAATLPGLSLLTCQYINKVVFSDDLDAVPTTTTASLTRNEGCINVSSSYTYYKVLGSSV